MGLTFDLWQNHYTLSVPSIEVAKLVETIANVCHQGDNTGGQIWDTDDFFVQVRGDAC